jgi:hypothetical protein
MRLSSWQFWALNGCAGLVMALVITNIALFLGNRTVQVQAAERQQFINQSIQLSRLNTQLIRALAATSAQTDDEEIRELLASHGVTFTVNPQAGDTTTEP